MLQIYLFYSISTLLTFKFNSVGFAVKTAQKHRWNAVSRQSYQIDCNTTRNHSALCSLYQGNFNFFLANVYIYFYCVTQFASIGIYFWYVMRSLAVFKSKNTQIIFNEIFVFRFRNFITFPHTSLCA